VDLAFNLPQQSKRKNSIINSIYRNLNIFASLLYHTFVGFVKRTVKLKKTDFRSDSDLFSETHLYDRYIIDKYIMQMDMQRTSEVEQVTVEFLSKILYVAVNS